MLTVKSDLTSLDGSSDGKPYSVSIQLNEEDMTSIKDAIAYLKKSGATHIKIRKVADLYFNNKNEQAEEFLNHSDEDYEWEETAEGLIIMLNSIYYTATNNFDNSDVLESEDLTEFYSELRKLFSEQEQKVVGYYVYGTEDCISLDENGTADEHAVEVRDFSTLEEKNHFEAGIEAAIGWERVWRTSPEEAIIENGLLTLKK